MSDNKMSSEEIQVTAFEIILHSGNGRTIVHEAFGLMDDSKFTEAQQKLDDANEEILQAHLSQNDLLKKYASGTVIDMEIIMVHAQDHLMTTMTLYEVANQMMNMYKKIAEK